MATERKMEPKLAEAAAKTTAVLETLRSRLSREAALQETTVMGIKETPDELDRELEEYFTSGTVSPSVKDQQPQLAGASTEVQIPNEIRAQVVDGVVDRILRSWGAPNGAVPASVKSDVIARLVEHVLGELLKKGSNPR